MSKVIMPPKYQSDLPIFTSCQMTLGTMRTDAHSAHKVCSCSRSKMQWWPQLSQKADVQILQKVLSHTEVSLTGSSMAALLFVGWLCSEECAGNRGGSLWLSQTIPNSFYFLSIALFLSKRPWPWFEPPVFLVWLCAPSDSGQVHMLSLNTGPPIVPIRDSLLRETGHWSDLLLPSLYSVVAAGRGRISFMLVAFNLWRFLLTF